MRKINTISNVTKRNYLLSEKLKKIAKRRFLERNYYQWITDAINET